MSFVWGNAMHAVRTQCEVLDVGKYSNPSFGPFSQVFGSVPGFFWLPKHLGCGIFELSTISPEKRPIDKVYTVDTTRISTSSLSTLQRASYP